MKKILISIKPKYVAPFSQKRLCALTKRKAKRYENRLSSMGVAYEIEVDE